MNILTDDNHPFQKAKNCAIVGNAPQLHGSGLGTKIDNHDVVVRLNAGPVEGWETDVGTKETARVVNCMIQSGNNLNNSIIPENVMEQWKHKYLILKPCLKRNIQLISESEKKNTVTQLNAVGKKRLNYYIKTCKGYPSTGLIAVWVMKHYVRDVTLFGFGGGYEEGEPIHYYEETTPEDLDGPVSHNWKWEYLELTRLLRHGVKQKP